MLASSDDELLDVGHVSVPGQAPLLRPQGQAELPGQRQERALPRGLPLLLAAARLPGRRAHLNFAFNVLFGVSKMWGQQPLLWYVYILTVGSAGLHALAICYGSLAWRRCWPILLLIACVLVPHSLIAHKEYRFVFCAVPLLLLLLADAIASELPRLHGMFGNRSTFPIVIGAIAAISVLGCAFRGVLKQDDRLLASLDLSRRRDLVAVLDLSGPWWFSGGFFYLHRDVPYYFKDQFKGGLPITEIRSLASHLLVRTTQSDFAGFRVSAHYGSIAILDQVSPPPFYRRLLRDGREPIELGIDDRLTPQVRPSLGGLWLSRSRQESSSVARRSR